MRRSVSPFFPGSKGIESVAELLSDIDEEDEEGRVDKCVSISSRSLRNSVSEEPVKKMIHLEQGVVCSIKTIIEWDRDFGI